MVELTEAARAELRRWLADDTRSDRVVVRVVYSDSDGWKLARDTQTWTSKDVALATGDDLPTLVCSPELAARLEGAILHYRGQADDNYGGAGLAVLWPRAGTARPDFSPHPTAQPRSHAINLRTLNGVFRRRIATGSTTQNASP